ncbi:hypothetical protein CHELA40_12920 [Chelatococcus asaccharovorans]|nr:hypothetical protein CHELA40_12920 [Chelatococcus asaccharovorans]
MVVSAISGIGVASGQTIRQPAVGIDPGDSLAGGEVEDMRAPAEDAGPGTRRGVGVLKAPSAGEAEGGGAAIDEPDDVLGVAGRTVAYPERVAPELGLNREQEAFGGRVFGGVFRRKLIVNVERAGGVVGGDDVEQAREAEMIVGHDRLQKRKSPARAGLVEGIGGLRRRWRQRRKYATSF